MKNGRRKRVSREITYSLQQCYGKLLHVIMFVRQLSIRSRVDPPDLLLNDHRLSSLLYVIMVLRLSRSVVVILINAWLELAVFCWN